MNLRLIVIGLALFCGATTASLAADETLTLTPMPGVSFNLPRGWKACDEATDKLLGSADDPLSLGKQICPAYAANAGTKLAAYSPKVGWSATFIFLYAEESPITGEIIALLTDEMIAQIGGTVRKDWEERVAAAGNKLDSTAVRKDTLAGYPALVSTILQTPPATGALGQSVTEIYEVPVNGHLYQFNITWAKILESNTTPMLNTIKASIKIE